MGRDPGGALSCKQTGAYCEQHAESWSTVYRQHKEHGDSVFLRHSRYRLTDNFRSDDIHPVYHRNAERTVGTVHQLRGFGTVRQNIFPPNMLEERYRKMYQPKSELSMKPVSVSGATVVIMVIIQV